MEVICCCCERKFVPNNQTSTYWGNFAETYSVVLCRSCTKRNDAFLTAEGIRYDGKDERNFNHWYPTHGHARQMRLLLPSLIPSQ
jgi:hypothetical protein